MKSKKKKIEHEKRISIELIKSGLNPIISPNPNNNWESWQTFNPAAILLEDKVHLLYRAIGDKGVSCFGYASSKNGLRIDERLPNPVFTHKSGDGKKSYYSLVSGGSWSGCEDPRLVRVNDDDKIYMTYTACENGLRVGLTSISVKDFLNHEWNWNRVRLISPPGEVNKNWVLFPEKINNKYAILHSISPEISITYLNNLNFENNEYIESDYERVVNGNSWDSVLRGVGAPPIKTEKGWLVFYHAMSPGEMHKYKVGVMLLDLKNPTRIVHKHSKPVLEPEEDYEWEGFKGGVVYVSGVVVKDGELFVYFGGADNYVCVAHTNLQKFLKAVIYDKKLVLKKDRVLEK